MKSVRTRILATGLVALAANITTIAQDYPPYPEQKHFRNPVRD